MKLPSQNWKFISNHKLRAMLRRDYAELQELQSIKAHKSIILMCGSMLEAILASLLKAEVEEGGDLRLAKLIKDASESDLLPPYISDRASDLRHYRNLIHPKNEIKDKVQLNKSLADSTLNGFLYLVGLLEEQSSKVSLETQFADRLKDKCSKDEVEIATQLADWANRNQLERNWTGQPAFMPILNHQGIAYKPFSITTTGQLFIRLGDMKSKPSRFRLKAVRQEALQRLNDIGLRADPAKFNGFPSFRLSQLQKNGTLTHLIEVLDWMAAVIRA